MQQPRVPGPILVLASVIFIAGCGEQNSMAVAATAPRELQPVPDMRTASATIPAQDESLAYRERQKSDDDIANAFGPTVWYVPPPPPPPQAPAPAALVQEQAPPAPKPTAPPLPFQYFGRYVDATSHVVMLVKGDQIYTVSEGETIDGNYRVERVAAGVIELKYLPLGTRQSLLTGDAS